MREWTRRGFLARVGWWSLGVGVGGLVTQQATGYRVPDGVRGSLRALSGREWVILAAVCGRVLDGVGDAETPLRAAVWADGYLARRAVWMRREVKALLAGLESSPPVMTGEASRFTRLGPEAQDAVLRAWERHRVGLVRQGFVGVKSLALMGGYGRREAWGAIGYGGPLERAL